MSIALRKYPWGGCQRSPPNLALFIQALQCLHVPFFFFPALGFSLVGGGYAIEIIWSDLLVWARSLTFFLPQNRSSALSGGLCLQRSHWCGLGAFTNLAFARTIGLTRSLGTHIMPYLVCRPWFFLSPIYPPPLAFYGGGVWTIPFQGFFVHPAGFFFTVPC